MELIIRNGVVCTHEQMYRADVGVDCGLIAAIGDLSDVRADKEVDAKGLLVLPGVIDVHTHVDHWGGTANTEDNFFSGTRAAALGGTTTIIDFAIQRADENVASAVERRRGQMDGLACIDYSIHCHLTQADDVNLRAVPELIGAGYPTFKLFTTYKAAGFKIEDPDCLDIFETLQKHGGMALIHCENDSFCETLTNRLRQQNRTGHYAYPASRPNIAEAEAIARMIMFSELTGAKVYIVHVTTREGVSLIRGAKQRGLPVEAETCTHYLALTDEVYQREDGYKFIMAPPLRKSVDQEALWAGLLDGTLSVVSSDHCDYSMDKKVSGETDFTKVSPGIHGIEYLLPIVYHLGVHGGRISISKLVDLLCYQPAKLFGLLPRKGQVSIGSDADLVLFDPANCEELSNTNHHMSSDYSPYNGLTVQGSVRTVISRGELLVEDGQFVGQQGRGRFLSRSV